MRTNKRRHRPLVGYSRTSPSRFTPPQKTESTTVSASEKRRHSRRFWPGPVIQSPAGKDAVRILNSELLTWGAGNLSAFWAFARGCDRVMHLQFRAGELGVSLVQVRAKRFEDSRSMRRTEWGQGDTKLLFRGFEISGIL